VPAAEGGGGAALSGGGRGRRVWPGAAGDRAAPVLRGGGEARPACGGGAVLPDGDYGVVFAAEHAVWVRSARGYPVLPLGYPRGAAADDLQLLPLAHRRQRAARAADVPA